MSTTESAEQRLRDALEAMGSTRAQSLSAGDLMEVVVVADGFQNDARLREQNEELVRLLRRCVSNMDPYWNEEQIKEANALLEKYDAAKAPSFNQRPG